MKRHSARESGFSTIEVVIATMILMIAVGGTVGFSKYCAEDVYRSSRKSDGGMLATMIMQAWRGQGGTSEFDPVQDLSDAILDCEDVGVRYSIVGPSVPTGFTLCWSDYPYYRIDVNGVKYRAALSYKYINGKKFLNVMIGWPSSSATTYWYSNSRLGITEGAH